MIHERHIFLFRRVGLWSGVVLGAIFCFFSPALANATTVNFHNSDSWQQDCGGGTVDLTTDVATFMTVGCSALNTRDFWVGTADTLYYAVINITGNGSEDWQIQFQDGDYHTAYPNITGQYEWSGTTATGGAGNSNLQFAAGSSWPGIGGGTTHIASICVSDVSFDECTGGGGPGPGTSTPTTTPFEGTGGILGIETAWLAGAFIAFGVFSILK